MIFNLHKKHGLLLATLLPNGQEKNSRGVLVKFNQVKNTPPNQSVSSHSSQLQWEVIIHSSPKRVYTD